MVVFVIPRLFTTSFIRPKNGGCLRLISMRMQLPPFNDSIGLVFKALECKHWHTEIGWFWTLGYFFVHKIHDHTQGSKVNNFIWNDLKKPNGSIGSYQSVPGPSKKKRKFHPGFWGNTGDPKAKAGLEVLWFLGYMLECCQEAPGCNHGMWRCRLKGRWKRCHKLSWWWLLPVVEHPKVYPPLTLYSPILLVQHIWIHQVCGNFSETSIRKNMVSGHFFQPKHVHSSCWKKTW